MSIRLIVRVLYVNENGCDEINNWMEYKALVEVWEELGECVDLPLVHYKQAFVDGVVHWLSCCRSSIVGFDVDDDVFREMKLPSDLQCSDSCLLIMESWGGSLAIIEFEYGKEICLWITTKFTVQFFGIERWIRVFGKNGEVIMEMDSSSLVTYDPMNNRVTRSEVSVDNPLHVCPYTESLVLFDRGSLCGEGTNRTASVTEFLIVLPLYLNSSPLSPSPPPSVHSSPLQIPTFPSSLTHHLSLTMPSFHINDDRDILTEILSRLDARSLVTASLVCRLWHSVARADSVWERLCFRHAASSPSPSAGARTVVVALGGYRRMYMVCAGPVMRRLLGRKRKRGGVESEVMRRRVWRRCGAQLLVSLFCVDYYERLGRTSGGGEGELPAAGGEELSSSLMFLCGCST
ncbi:hypothetical protein Droror1_Dr00022917 [Drosera rotundifolia]